MSSHSLSFVESPAVERAPRATCYACFRPAVLCYCARLPNVESRTRIVIVQHPREQFHPINTARLVERSLGSSVVLRGGLDALERQVRNLDLSSDTALLFPSADAVDLGTLAPEERPTTVVVLDGTWHQAKTLLRDLPALAPLRRVRFTPDRPSEYRIRKEPKDDYLSTLESIALVLETLESDFDGTPIRRLFREVIDANIAARRSDWEERRFRRRPNERQHRFPEILLETDEPTFAYAEGAPLGEGASLEPGKRRAPLYLRLERRSTLELLLETPAPPSERLLAHLGFDRATYEARKVSVEEAARRVAAWLPENAAVFAWNGTTFSILRELGVAHRPCVLKGIYCSLKRFVGAEPEEWGGITAAIEREGLALEGEGARGEKSEVADDRGRGARRLRETRALGAWLRSQALRGESNGSETVAIPAI